MTEKSRLYLYFDEINSIYNFYILECVICNAKLKQGGFMFVCIVLVYEKKNM